MERKIGRNRVLDACMGRRPALGHRRVKLGGVKLQTVTNRSPGRHTEKNIERWGIARTRGRLKSWVLSKENIREAMEN